MRQRRGKQEELGWLSFLVADERLSKFPCKVRRVTVMALLLDNKPSVILTVEKTGKGNSSPSFHRSAPNLSEVTQEDVTIHVVKSTNERVPSPKAFHATEAQSMENLMLNRLVKLAPLESCLEVKKAQIQKIVGFKRDAQLAASKLASVGSVSSEPRVKEVKNLPQGEMENLHRIKMAVAAILDNQDQNCSSTVSQPTCEFPIILPTEGDPKLQEPLMTNGPPIPCHQPAIPQNFQAPDFQETAKIGDSCSQGSGRRRFRLKQMKEQESLGKTKPLKTAGHGVEEGKQKMVHLRAQKTLSKASKLLESIAKKHRERRDESDEIDKDLLMRIRASRRMALGDITQVDED